MSARYRHTVVRPMPEDRPSETELLAGRVFGEAADAAALPPVDSGVSPRLALEEAMLPAVSASPCLVSFSGGRDSSLVLAVATRVAQEHGLDLPVPVTLRFPGDAAAEEGDWQRLVLDHLGLKGQVFVDMVDDQLEALGPVACGVLSRHGVQMPANTYMHAPLFDLAKGGALITGYDGDGLLMGWKWERLALLSLGRARPTRRDLAAVVYASAPTQVKRVLTRVHFRAPEWLSATGLRIVRAAELARWSPEPLRWDHRVDWWSRRRYLALARRGYDALAAGSGARVFHPLLDPSFLSAVAARGGRYGLGGRTEAMRVLAADLLPEAAISRTTKASFGTVLFGPRTRAYACSARLPVALSQFVDPEKLSAVWARPVPPFGIVPLLQQAWLSSDGS